MVHLMTLNRIVPDIGGCFVLDKCKAGLSAGCLLNSAIGSAVSIGARAAGASRTSSLSK